MFPEVTRDDVFRIETRRLWLRWPRVQDAAIIEKLASDKDIAEMVGVLPHPFPQHGGDAFVFEARKANATGQQIKLAITRRDKPEQMLGIVGSRWLSAEESAAPVVSLGYWLGTSAWGHGYATEAAQGLIDALFSYTSAVRIETKVRVINAASRRVMEKCGFQFVGSEMWEAPALKSLVPVDCFMLTRTTWQGLKRWQTPRIEIDSAQRDQATMVA